MHNYFNLRALCFFAALKCYKVTKIHTMFFGIVSRRLLSMIAPFLGAVLVFGSALFAVWQRHAIGSALAGLSVSYAMLVRIDFEFSHIFRSFSTRIYTHHAPFDMYKHRIHCT